MPPRWVDHAAFPLRGVRHNPFDPTVPWPFEERIEGACPECAGAGEVLEQIDDDRFPTPVPCHRCRMYCKECKQWVPKQNHVHRK